jgi:hypothetical protein
VLVRRALGDRRRHRRAFTLFVVPGAYVIMQSGGDRLKAWVTGRRTHEGVPAEVPAAGD